MNAEAWAMIGVVFTSLVLWLLSAWVSREVRKVETMSGQRQKVGCEHVEWRVVGDKRIEVVGCWDKETPEGQYDFYDLYFDGTCINEGEPCYDGKPTDEDITAFLELYEALA